VEGGREEGRKEGREGGRARVHDDILVLVLLLSSSFLNQGSPASNLTFILFFPPSLPPSLLPSLLPSLPLSIPAMWEKWYRVKEGGRERREGGRVE